VTRLPELREARAVSRLPAAARTRCPRLLPRPVPRSARGQPRGFPSTSRILWRYLLGGLVAMSGSVPAGAAGLARIGPAVGVGCVPELHAGCRADAVVHPVAGRIYRWVDKRGLVHFSDSPPPPAVSVPPPAQVSSDTASPAAAAPAGTAGGVSAAGQGDGSDGATPPGPPAEPAPAPERAEPPPDIVPGMTETQVMRLWGRPDRVRHGPGPNASDEQWFYDEGPQLTQRVDLSGGRVVALEELNFGQVRGSYGAE
jgi:Domain of unknown function (DUF4124)